MEDLTFGEQVKIILGRKGMTIKQLAEQIEEKTGKKMSRQNLTQRLGRDNFQEQDMRMIASILECPFYLSIMGEVQHKSIVKAERPTAEHEVPEQAAAAAMPEIAAAAVVNEQVQSGMDTAVSESIEDMSAENNMIMQRKKPKRRKRRLCPEKQKQMYRRKAQTCPEQKSSLRHLKSWKAPTRQQCLSLLNRYSRMKLI